MRDNDRKNDDLASNRELISKRKRRRIYAKYNGKCALCGKHVDFKEFTIDHRIPLTLHGTNDDDNLQVACSVCNQLKGGLSPEYFQEKIADIFMYQMERKLNNKELEIIKMITEV